MLDFDNVSFRYPSGDVVLSGLTLSIRQYVTTAIMGPSGCGKTTMLKLACGLLAPDSGVVSIGHQVVRPGSVRGVLFHEDTFLPWLTVVENVLFATSKTNEDRSKANELLRGFGLSTRMHAYPFELSAGMRKRVEFARALVSDSRLLLLDEPFSSLDYSTREELWRLWLTSGEKERRTNVIVSHDAEEASRLADRILVFRDGTPLQLHTEIDVPNDQKGTTSMVDSIRKLVCGG